MADNSQLGDGHGKQCLPQWELALKFQAGQRLDPGYPNSKITIIYFCEDSVC